MTDRTDAAQLPRYDVWLGEQRLLDPRPNATDEAIRRFVQERSHHTVGQETPAALTETEAYTLLTFARRSAVFALRAREPDAAELGRIACALIDNERVDPRDILVANAIIDYALMRTRSGAVDSSQPGPNGLRDDWGHVEVEVDGEAGLIGWGFRPWSPTHVLVDAIVAIARLFDEDRYIADDPMIATELPEYWLLGPDDERVRAALASALGAASVNARMRPDVPDAPHQQLTAWLVEFRSHREAADMASISRRVAGPFVATASVAGPLLSLIIARSYVEGTDGVETFESIARFASPIHRIIGHGVS